MSNGNFHWTQATPKRYYQPHIHNNTIFLSDLLSTKKKKKTTNFSIGGLELLQDELTTVWIRLLYRTLEYSNSIGGQELVNPT